MSGGKTGATYDYGFRVYDARIARFLSEDPLTKEYPWYTPYQFAGNMPIAAIDLDGQEEYICIYSPTLTEAWMTKLENPSSKDVVDVWLEAVKMTNKTYSFAETADLRKKYDNVITFQREHGYGGDKFRQSTSWTGNQGNFAKSGALCIEGYDSKGNKVILYQTQNWGDVNKTKDKKLWQDNQDLYSALKYKDRFEGQYGYDHGGKQLFFGIVGAYFGIAEIAAGVTGIMAIYTYVSLANDIDDVVGNIIWEGGDSFTVGLSDNRNVKLTITGLKTIIDVGDAGKGLNEILTDGKVVEQIFNVTSTAKDGESVRMDVKDIQKIINEK